MKRIFFIYGLSFLFVSPFYEYPIGDAWTYAKVARSFYETGTFQILPWYGQSLLFQIGWAHLFLFPFGFSFSALHLSNAVMGCLAILFFDRLMKSLGFKEEERFWGTLLLVVSPPFIFLSRTFYTDLPFLALYLAAAWAYSQGCLHRSTKWLFIGSFFLSLSVLVRQVAIFLPFVLLMYLHRERKRFSFGQRAIPLIPFFSLGLFTVWQHLYFHGVPPANLLLSVYALRIDKVLGDFIRIPLWLFLYFGYYLSPVLLPPVLGLFEKRNAYRETRTFFLLGAVLFGLFILIWGLRRGAWMPDYLPRGFHLRGAHPFYYVVVSLCSVFGAAAFFAAYYPRYAARFPARVKTAMFLLLALLVLLSLPPVRSALLSLGEGVLPTVYRFFSERLHLYQTLETWHGRLPLLYRDLLLSLFTLFCVGTLLVWIFPSLVKQKKLVPSEGKMTVPEKLLHRASLLYLLLLLFLPVTTDRYLFPVFPSAILLSVRAASAFPYRKVLGVLLVLCVFIPSLLHTDRTIQRVGALWKGGNTLLARRIPAESIDAGFVFNGWHLYEKRQEEGFEGTDRGFRKEGWWVKEALYRVAPAVSEGYEVLYEVPYRDLLTPSKDVVYVTQKGGR